MRINNRFSKKLTYKKIKEHRDKRYEEFFTRVKYLSREEITNLMLNLIVRSLEDYD